MTKSDSAIQAAPRRSTRTRAKRSAESEAEQSEEDAPNPKAAKQRVPAAKEQSEDKPASKRGRRKAQPAAAKQPDAAEQDLPEQAYKTSKASKAAKQSKEGATQAATAQAETTMQGKPDSAKAANQKTGKPAADCVGSEPSGGEQSAAADPACPKAHTSTVAGNADVMLNQTNIGANNNKFYRMQLLREDSSEHWLWTRWGRVGDKGQSQLQGPFDADTGLREFKKKFSKLEGPTKDLMELIFSDIMFQQAMQEFDIDTERLPLGQLSKEQVQRGYDVLERIRTALNSGGESLERLSSEFYQVIPHNFGRQRPPIIHSQRMVEDKIRMCDVLNDIEVAQDLLDPKQHEEEQKVELQPHPADEKYASLKADLNIIQPKEEEYRIVEKYCQATGSGQQLMRLWRVDRHSEAAGFAKHSKLENRRLLWHGTNIAVVAAILKAGLRIMPHACGRVMFLAEAALGEEHHITRDDPSLTKAPAGFDSVVAKGHTEPDPSQDVKLDIEGGAVKVPQGKPVQMSEYKNSSFSQSEYLLYQESQARIRYMLTMKFSHAGGWH
ncbi:MAG: poly [ADP-ribose] polymerase 3-like [Trebouxia sp. A1-2]|nr:MAG: poly [ADP-ribose] polymerase 3-like [Trebouxia sp. A1-2]